MKLTFLGATKTVTGSKYLIEHDKQKILIDCGLFQGEDTKDDLAIEFDITNICALIVTHCHIDHVGRIPYLLAAGFKGPIYTSKASASLLPLVIEDALKVVKLLKEKNILVSLGIIGLATPNYLSDLTKIIDHLKINNHVTIISKEVSTKFLINEINQSTMLWLPYKKINQSGVSYTSIGLEKPFVGYNVGNFKAFFGDKGVAKIVEKDNIEAFSEGVIEIIKNEELYKINVSISPNNNANIRLSRRVS